MNIKLLLSAILLIGATFNSNAIDCTKTLKKKTGKVYSASPGIIELKNCPSNTVSIKILKTAGKAKTQVNIYINGVMQPKVFNFKNGSYKDPNWTVYKLPNVKNKKVTLKVINQSVGNTFSYDCRIVGKSSSLAIGKSQFLPELLSGTKKTIYTVPSCTNKTNFAIIRMAGNARVRYRIWEKLPNGQWREMTNELDHLEPNDSGENVIITSNKPLKLEIKNVSNGVYVNLRVSAFAQ